MQGVYSYYLKNAGIHTLHMLIYTWIHSFKSRFYAVYTPTHLFYKFIYKNNIIYLKQG